jgi:hypothetical protein
MLWKTLAQFIREHYPTQEDLKFFYGKRYRWALRFRIQGKLLASLYPTQNGFTVQVNLDAAAIEEVQRMQMGENVQQAIVDAYPYPEGRWLFIPVQSESDVRDIRELLDLRVKTKHLQK